MRSGLPSLVCCLLVLALGACAPESPTAFVVGNLVPDATCLYSDSGEIFRPVGAYDISGGSEGACEAPYQVTLKIYSLLRAGNDPELGRSEPNWLRVHSAEVKLTNLERQPLGFEAEEDPLPNPFLVISPGLVEPAPSGSDPAAGLVSVEVIPPRYAPYLSDFINDKILAEVQLFGTTTGDIDVDFQKFTYPIEICDGCMTVCASDLSPADPMGKTREELANGQCDDNSGSDGRFCVDPDC